MELTQQSIDEAVKAYNQVTKAHKRAPVVKFVEKRLSEGEEVAMSSGRTRWSSALVFGGSLDDPAVEFRINPALPESFREMLNEQKQAFDELVKDL